MLRRLASKLRLPNPAPHTTSTAGAPGLTNSFVSKEYRDAALRERGLLPPLPLSVQEHQQDQELGVQPLPPSESSQEMTMAKKIKQEWEAKNREQAKVDSPPAQLDRMKSFRFGGSASQSSSSLKKPAVAPDDTEAVPELDSPTLPTADIPASSSNSTSSSPSPPVKAELATPPPRTHSSIGSSSSPIRQSTSSSNDKELPSPPAKDTLAFTPSSPTSAKFSVPPSPQSLTYTTPLPPSMPATPSSGSGSGSRTPRQNTIPQSPSKAKSPAFRIDTVAPNIFSPPASPMSTRSTNLTPSSSGCTDDSSTSQSLAPTPVSTGSQARPSSFASSSAPSLDSSSQATSTSASSYGSNKGLGVRLGAGHTLIPGLSARALDQGITSVPVIVESPIEEAMVLPSSTSSQDHMYLDATGKEAIKSAVTVTLQNESSLQSSPPLASPPPPAVPRLRAPTANKKGDRRKSLGIFKRDDDANGMPTKRISVSASFGNLRRSVVGTINSSGSSSSNRQSTYSGDSSLSSFDATHLPPSPTLPASFSSGASAGGLSSSSSAPTRLRPQKNHGPPPVSVRPRQALSPTMHSRGSILIEAGSIEDDESRRLSEMAFLT